MQVLDKGEVTLLNRMGGDESVIAAARVSNGATYDEASKGPEADQKLISYLVKHRHGTPFEHATFQFYIKAPLFVRSEWHRHRMASYNEISGRYVEYKPEFYIPEGFRVPGSSNKQGSIYPETAQDIHGEEPWIYVDHWDSWCKAIFQEATEKAYDNYQALLAEGLAKEMARMILPSNLYTQFYMTVNARSLMNFLSLRTAPDAQWEIRQYAKAMLKMFEEVMPMTFNAWVANGCVAP